MHCTVCNKFNPLPEGHPPSPCAFCYAPATAAFPALVCPGCRAPLAPGRPFCAECGARVGAAKTPRRLGRIVLLGAGAVGVLLLCGVGGGIGYFYAIDGLFPWEESAAYDNAPRTVQVAGAAGEQITIEVPSGVISQKNAARISGAIAPLPADIKAIAPVAGPEIPVEGFVAAGTGVRLEPDGLQFKSPVSVRIPIKPAASGGGPCWVLHSERGRFGETIWRPVESMSIDKKAGYAVVPVKHFSELQPVSAKSGAPAARRPPVKRPGTETDRARLKQIVRDFITKRFQKSCFGMMVRLGDTGYFDKAFDGLEVVIDPSQALDKAGEMSPDGSELMLTAEIPEQVTDDYAKTVWHEIVHRIEVHGHWDRWGYTTSNEATNPAQHWWSAPTEVGTKPGPLPLLFQPGGEKLKARAEHRTEYMEHMFNRLTQIEQIEKLAQTGSLTPEQIRQRFQIEQKSADAGSVNSFLPIPDRNQLREWTGFSVDIEAIKRLYATGQCGDRLKEAFGGAGASASASAPSCLPGPYQIGGKTNVQYWFCPKGAKPPTAGCARGGVKAPAGHETWSCR